MIIRPDLQMNFLALLSLSLGLSLCFEGRGPGRRRICTGFAPDLHQICAGFVPDLHQICDFELLEFPDWNFRRHGRRPLKGGNWKERLI